MNKIKELTTTKEIFIILPQEYIVTIELMLLHLESLEPKTFNNIDIEC